MRIRLYIYTAFVLLVTVWCLAIVAAPVLSSSGETSRATGLLIYEGFSRICHQIDERSFHIAGLKLGVCIRCCSIYFGFLGTLILLPIFFNLERLRIPSVRWFLIAIAPMLVDVIFHDTGVQPSTLFSRLTTGLMLGAVLPLYIVPPLLEAATRIKTALLNAGEFHARKTQ